MIQRCGHQAGSEPYRDSFRGPLGTSFVPALPWECRTNNFHDAADHAAAEHGAADKSSDGFTNNDSLLHHHDKDDDIAAACRAYLEILPKQVC